MIYQRIKKLFVLCIPKFCFMSLQEENRDPILGSAPLFLDMAITQTLFHIVGITDEEKSNKTEVFLSFVVSWLISCVIVFNIVN